MRSRFRECLRTQNDPNTSLLPLLLENAKKLSVSSNVSPTRWIMGQSVDEQLRRHRYVSALQIFHSISCILSLSLCPNMDSTINNESNDSIETIKKCRTDFRLSSCKMLMDMCNDIGDAVQSCTGIERKTKFQLVECRNAILSKIERVHESEQRDAQIAKDLKQKNRSYRRIRFNETELKMLEEIIEIKNDPKNKAKLERKMKKNSKKKKSFISSLSDEQKHKNYKEFMKSKQEEFNEKMTTNLGKLARKSNSRTLPPITPRELENVVSLDQEETSQDSQHTLSTDNTEESQMSQTSSQELLAQMQSMNVPPTHQSHRKKVSKKSLKASKVSRRFELGNQMTLKNQMKEVRQLKRIKLDDLSSTKPKQGTHHYVDHVYLPGQLWFCSTFSLPSPYDSETVQWECVDIYCFRSRHNHFLLAICNMQLSVPFVTGSSLATHLLMNQKNVFVILLRETW